MVNFKTDLQDNKDWNGNNSGEVSFTVTFKTDLQDNKDWNWRGFYLVSLSCYFKTDLQDNKDWNPQAGPQWLTASGLQNWSPRQ